MNLTNFFKIANLTAKEIALMDYFRIKEVVKKYHGDFLLTINATDGYDTFTYKELEELIAAEDTKDDVNCWRTIISAILNIDLVAQKNFYQMVTIIYRSYIFKDKDIQLLAIKETYSQFITNTFTALVLNKLFKDLIDIQSPDLLTDIPSIEKEPISFCLLLKQGYLKEKAKIKETAQNIMNEVIERSRDSEHISSDFVSSSIDYALDVFKQSYRLLDFEPKSDTIGLKT